METQGKKRSILRDLALIYIAFAHSTDQELSAPEVDAISDRLRTWQTQATEETVLSAIKHALEDYTQEKAQEALDAAIRRVREELDQESCQGIVDDLVDIAMADNVFLYREGTFISQLANAWDIHFTPLDTENLWTVLSSSGNKNGWTSVHDLALIYLHVANGVDGNFQEEEVDAVAARLSEWIPDADENRVLRVVREAMQAYVQGSDTRLFEESVESLRSCVPPHQRAAILTDLNFIAQADGTISDDEKQMIEYLSRAWGGELTEQES